MYLADDATESELAEMAAEQREIDEENRAYEFYARQEELALEERAKPGFQYWTIAYTYPVGSATYPNGITLRIGAYADRGMAAMNARLNPHLQARVEPVYY